MAACERRANRSRLELPRGPLRGSPAGPWDFVVSNPPYVLLDEMARWARVRDWEPREALVGVGADRGDRAEQLDVLRPGGALVLEVADGPAERGGGPSPRIAVRGRDATST